MQSFPLKDLEKYESLGVEAVSVDVKVEVIQGLL